MSGSLFSDEPEYSLLWTDQQAKSGYTSCVKAELCVPYFFRDVGRCNRKYPEGQPIGRSGVFDYLFDFYNYFFPTHLPRNCILTYRDITGKNPRMSDVDRRSDCVTRCDRQAWVEWSRWRCHERCWDKFTEVPGSTFINDNGEAATDE
ncbi:hypothetical protein FOL46_005718 [Perkinsus olseni]|uniref:Uncharacterized protein n=1 Tax=Perkinsus olseni TaxID=32597 RepID=A0A7J6LQC2_PEROL|nr:hypothetical protein FOL46_005718 [Perkinsus olseni]